MPRVRLRSWALTHRLRKCSSARPSITLHHCRDRVESLKKAYVHSSLLKLIGLRARAGGRQMVRGLKTPRGALLFLGGCAMVVLWLGPAFLVAVTQQRIVDPQTTRAGVPAVLLLMSV